MPWDRLLWLCGAGTLCLLCASLLLVRTCLTVVTVRGESMAPTLLPGDHVLAVRFVRAQRLRKGQVILFWQTPPAQAGERPPLALHIKRIAALGGETYVASSPESGEEVFHKEAQHPCWQVPPQHLFVCGDNYQQSIDSRTWGPLPQSNVRGLIVMNLSRRARSSERSTTHAHASHLHPEHP